MDVSALGIRICKGWGNGSSTPESFASMANASALLGLRLHIPPAHLGLPSLPSGPNAGNHWPLGAE